MKLEQMNLEQLKAVVEYNNYMIEKLTEESKMAQMLIDEKRHNKSKKSHKTVKHVIKTKEDYKNAKNGKMAKTVKNDKNTGAEKTEKTEKVKKANADEKGENMTMKEKIDNKVKKATERAKKYKCDYIVLANDKETHLCKMGGNIKKWENKGFKIAVIDGGGVNQEKTRKFLAELDKKTEKAKKDIKIKYYDKAGEEDEVYKVFVDGKEQDLKVLFKFDTVGPQCVVYKDDPDFDGVEFETENDGMLYLEKLLA